MAFAKFQENRFRIDGEINENHAILVNLTAKFTNCNSPTVWTDSLFGQKKQMYKIEVEEMYLPGDSH